MIEDALHARKPPERLSEWMDVISTSNANKSAQMARYARVFAMQHYLRQLKERHSDALLGQLTKLQGAFVRYFGVSDETVDNDLTLIRKAQRAGDSANKS
jgi:hypothetical protein